MTKTFGDESTTDEVLDGVDLAGKRILVTGVSAGLGVETARALAAHGALWSARATARTAMWPRSWTIPRYAAAFAPTRSTPTAPRHSGPRARRWWASGSEAITSARSRLRCTRSAARA
jgi:hypothetical protein